MTKPKRKTRRFKGPRNKKISKIASSIRIAGRNTRPELFFFKESADPSSLLPSFKTLFRDRKYIEIFHGEAFPERLDSLYSVEPLYVPVHPTNEAVWAIATCLQFGPELREFNSIREEFERSLLKDERATCEMLLGQVKDKFGASLWHVQNELALTRVWQGVEETRKFLRSLEDSVPDGSLVKFILWFVGRRTEATGIRDHLKNELVRTLEPYKNESFSAYLRVKLFELPSMSARDLSATLFWDAQSCIIDYYETLILALQSVASDQVSPTGFNAALSKPLLALHKQTGDARLLGIMRGLGVVPNSGVSHNRERALLIEAYTKGDYQCVTSIAQEYLSRHSDDLSMQVLALKAGLQTATVPAQGKGVMQEISERLLKILSTSDETYLAAYELLTLTDRFYGHNWSTYLRAVVLYELRQESASFPPLWLRDIYVRDLNLSPFGALAAQGHARDEILRDETLRELFPYTFAALDAMTTGKICHVHTVDQVRLNKYLGRYHLAFGDPSEAASRFEWLMGKAEGNDWLRCAAGAALSYLKLERIEQAVELTVVASVRKKNAHNILPLQEVIGSLGEPPQWPASVAVPLAFELYVTMHDRDRLSHLRYAFERFQVKNQINSPEELAAQADRFGKDLVVAYMDRVWRPEVMRQTILYTGTKEIEDTRVRVCRVLVDVDPQNSTKYVEEIKERVKQQEIAKGTTLIEQSKVYVDVEAIKKSLRSTLGDSYARYKSSFQSSSSKSSQLMYDLFGEQADAGGVSMAMLLSKVHLVGEIASTESDAQFEALFSEVTNEFLRGAHGLNAYLSTRVRHGTLSNTLRKPVADEQLVTEREEGSSSYIRNEYWRNLWGKKPKFDDEWNDICDALDKFSAEFDSVIDYVKDELIQIKVITDLQDDGSSDNALFVYRSSALERKYVQEYVKDMSDMDEFVGYCVDILWEKTDDNLLSVQRVLNNSIRRRLMLPFDDLSNSLTSLSHVPGVGDIINAVARAKTNTQARLGFVVSWFKRSEVYDRQDYHPDFPFHVALNMISNTISSASRWEGASIEVSQGASLMPGRTLDGMVYVFYGLLENAILRAGLSAEDLTVKAEISFENGLFSANIVNPVNSTILTREEREKVSALRKSLNSGESIRRAQSEGRSGLRKIWLAINSPIYKEPFLDFYHEENFFVVNIGFKLEG
ncbi:hypothetical protein [Thiohalomonas denitrificans]|uniref:Uncharacterized protein n=1 Tax=Thiohalomonas denitrificans TaxID=415747 RepID=A0A1G5QBY0_9GAMM|nr:hypothetical protein [Thiohalomonas denitrificans]SCZ59385.1 hypothetical protein SAMN03097708_01851 [Thiohalomonas denitrificans]